MNLEQEAQLNPKEFCRDCHKFATWQECSNCYKPICDECAIKCAECGAGDVRCVSCAIKAGFEECAGHWYCENCPVPEPEHECNDCGIMIPTSRPICTLCEKWYEERGLPLPKPELPENVLTEGAAPEGRMMKATLEQQLGFLSRDVLPVLKAVANGYRYTPGDSDLDDEQPVHVRMTLGDYRRSVRLSYELSKPLPEPELLAPSVPLVESENETIA